MAQTFEQIADGWVFCTLRLLKYRWERCRALARTDAQRTAAAKMLAKYLEDKEAVMREVIREGGDVKPYQLVLQRGHVGRYEGPLLHGRFQVMESLAPAGTYYLVDHMLEDLILRVSGPASDVLRFPTREAAEAAALRLLETTPAVDTAGGPSTRRRAPVGAPKEIIKMARQAKQAAAPAPAPETTGKRRTVASAFQELIRAGGISDDEIFARVQKEFGLPDSRRTYVPWYRNYLEKKGEKLPPRIEVETVSTAARANPAALRAVERAKAEALAKAAAAKPAARGRKAAPVEPAPVPVRNKARGRNASAA